ncbi:MAG TPA: pyridoxal-phosphate dependent enzyme, partial [Bacillales bacterium]|nr:pyridoxal-phosphate dependent enzyme [Bacillales bacterium]
FPAWIMQGYLTIVAELIEKIGTKKPTHVVLQAGVGSFAGAMASMLKQIYGEDLKIIVVEPVRADCLYQSALAGDGHPHATSGDLSTMMAGLSCGEPNPIGWDILKNVVDSFVSCSDEIAARGMRILGNPISGDAKITAGESGAVPVGLLYEIMKNDQYQELRDSVKLDESAKVLIINTEGATDPGNYKKVMRGGTQK